MKSFQLKKLVSKVLAASLTLAMLNGPIVMGPQTASAATNSIFAEADAYVDGGNTSTNYDDPAFNLLSIKEDSNLSVTRRVFMRFDLSTLPAANTITKAEVKVFAKAPAAVSLNVYAVEDIAWNQTTINWNNMPSYGVKIGSISLDTTDGYYAVDLTDYIKTQRSLGKASIMITNTTSTQIQIYDTERPYDTQRPKLEYTTDDTAPVYQTSTVSANFKDIQLNFNEPLLLNAGVMLKDHVYVATDGVTFNPLGTNDTTTISGSGIQVQLEQGLSGSLNKIKVLGSSLKDTAGNVLTAPVITEALIGTQDASAPVFISAAVGGNGKSVALTYDKPISMTGTADQLKANMTLSQDGGTTYTALQSADQVAISGNVVTITFNQALTGIQNKVKVASGALQSTSNTTPTAVDTVTSNLGGIENARTLAVTEDARVDSGASNVSTNYGTESTMILKEGGSTFNRRIFLKFNVSSLGIYNSVKLRLNFTDAGATAEPLNLYAVDDSWTEGGLTYANQPVYGAAISTTNVGAGNGWYEWDVTSYVQQQKLADGIASFMLLGTNSSTNRVVSGKESGANAPQLVVNFDNLPPAYTDSTVSYGNKTIELMFSEVLSDATVNSAALKSAITIARDGSNFVALDGGDQVSLTGTKLTITLANRLSAPGAKIRVAANTLQDSGQNVLASIVTTNALMYDVTAPVLNPVLQTDATSKQFTLSADEALLSHMATAADLKNAVTFSIDGTTFLPLASGDTVEITGGKLKVTRTQSLSGSLNKLRVAANTLKDAAGNVVSQSYTSDAVVADTAAPTILSAYPSNFNKKLVVVFSENAFNNLSDDAQLKQAIMLSSGGGAGYHALETGDKAILSGSTLTLILNQPLTGSQNKIRIQAGTLKDAVGNVATDDLTTPAIEAASIVYPYLPPRQVDLQKAMADTVNITFGNKDSAEGSAVELKATKGLSFIAEEIVAGNRDSAYIDRYVSTVRRMLTTPANLPNLQGGLDARPQSSMLYSIALLWNDQEVMSQFTDAEKSKLVTFFKAGLISTAYTLNDYNESGNLRPGDRLGMNGDPNNWNGTGVNYWEPNLTIFFTSSFILGLENVKEFLQNYDHADFIAELSAQGLTKIKESFEKTTNFSTAATEAAKLAEKADKVERTIKPSNWSFKGVTLEQYLQNPFKLHEASQRKSWTHVAQEGDYMGQLGMGHEFDAVDTKGSRQSASYVVLGIDPSLQNTRIMTYFGFMNAPGNEAGAADIIKLQRVGVSDYYAKVVNGYFTQSSYEITTAYLPESFFINSMMSMGYLKPALFNDTFNYDGVTSKVTDNWLVQSGSWQAVNDSIVPYNTKDPVSHMTGAKPVDENEKLLKQDNATGSAVIYSKKSFDNVSYLAWIKDMTGGETGLLARVQDENNFYLFSYSNGKLAIKKKAAGSLTTLAETNVTLTAGAAHRLRAVLNGNSLELHVDGVQQLTTTDNALTSGAIGLYANQASAKFDGVLVQNASVHAPDFQSIGVGNTKLFLTYSEVPGVIGYKVKYGTSPGNYTNTLITTSTTPVITGLTNDTTYYFAVSPIDPTGESANSRELSFMPKVPDAVAPTITNIITNGNRLVINFTMDPKNTSYTLRYGTGPGSYTKAIDNITASGYAVTVPVSQAPYYFAIEGRNANGSSSLSNEWKAMANNSTLFSDDFNDGEYASDWVLSVGSPVIENGKIKTANGNPERLWLPLGTDWSDYAVSATFTLLPDDVTKEVGLLGRVHTAANYYVADYKYDKAANTEKVMLRRKVNNAFLPDLAFDFTLNKQLPEHKMKAIFDGSQMKLYIDDVLAYDIVDTSLTKGTVGIFSVLTPVYFDDFKVEQLNGLSQPVITSISTTNAKSTAVFSKVEGAQGYNIKYGTQSHTYTKQVSGSGDAFAGTEIPGLTAGTTYYFTVSATNNTSESPNAEEYRFTIPAGGTDPGPVNSDPEDPGSANPGTIPTTAATPTTSSSPSANAGQVSITPVLVGNAAHANMDAETLSQAFQHAAVDKQGHKMVNVTLSELKGAKAYTVDIPKSGFLDEKLGNSKSEKAVRLQTPVGTVTIPDNMFQASDLKQASVVGVSIGWADTSLLNADVKRKIGDKPVIELQASLDGKVVAWKNNNAPVTVSIPYTPTAQELKNPEHLAIWYLDGAGQIIKMPAKFDAATGKLTFATTHFSLYAVGYEVKTFTDLSQVAWAKNAIEVLTSKGIVNGTTDTTFSPGADISRAEFLQLLIGALGITAEVETNFTDVQKSDYFYEAAGIAQTLGISDGVGNNRLNPSDAISRQDMMVMVERAMRIAGKDPGSKSVAKLSSFKDAGQVADYAKNSLQSLISSGLVEGSNKLLHPLGQTTRAEAAVLMYRVYNN